MAKDYVCTICKNKIEGRVEPIEKLCDQMQNVNRFRYLEDRLDVGEEKTQKMW